MSAKISAVVVGVSLALGSVAVTLAPQVAIAQAKDSKTVNPKVGAALQAAMTAIKNKQFDVATSKIKEAEAEKKTSFEGGKINEVLVYLYRSQNKFGELAALQEKMLEGVPGGDNGQINAKIIAQTYTAAQQYPKAIEFTKRWLQTHPNDGETLAQLGQLYYLTHDYKACKETVNNAIANTEKAGGRPNDNLLKFARTCAESTGDSATATQVVEKQVRYYPTAESWRAYIIGAARSANDLAEFHWARLKSEVGLLKDAEDYSSFAQQGMLSYGSAVEALRIVEDGYKKQILGADEKTKVRHQNLLTKAKEAAQAEKANLPKLAADADADATGEKNIKAGLAYFGAEQYDLAIAQLEKGIKKGAKEAGNAKLTLGVAQLRKGQRDAARATFKSLNSDAALGKVAAAWTLRSFN